MKRIPLTKGLYAIVDDADYAELNKHKWHAISPGRTHYAARYSSKDEGCQYIFMHRQLVDPPPGKEVDHINHDGIDNRRSNLRVVTRSQNNWNQRKTRGNSRYKGVHFERFTGRWLARIKTDGKSRNLGRFDCEEEAARAYDAAATEAWGDFAHPNFP